jgi:hypothetical protein
MLALAVAPGGFLEKATTAVVRPRLSAAQVSALPQRGPFTFPAPYLTEGSRITNATDCGGTDCVLPVGYSYWRNTNNHVGSDTMLIFLGLTTQRGGPGPSLFAYDKTTGAVTNRGPMFPVGNRFRDATAEGWYFSATRPTTLYMLDGSKFLRYDVEAKTFQTVFDVAPTYGSNRYVWQPHSSNDDRVHSVTLRDTATRAMLGCLVYKEDTAAFSFFPSMGGFDECHVDKSGKWLVILDNVDGRNQQDNRIINLDTGAETVLLDEQGAGGHSDLGFGYLVGEDDWAADPGTARLWNFDQPMQQTGTQGVVTYHTTNWSADLGHVSHENARPGVAPSQQYACSSNATYLDLPRSNEVVCFRLDGSLDVLVVAPVMTDLNAAGGGDFYSKHPMGNLDVTGQYLVWTTNLGGNRLDAVVVRVPGQKLLDPSSDTTPPTVAITAPSGGTSVTARTWVSAQAADASGVVGVRFQVDGANIDVEDTVAPFDVSWDTSTATQGTHRLTAIARDAAGNSAVSAAVTVSVGSSGPDTVPPIVTSVRATSIAASAATITWTTNEPSTSRVLYGRSTTYLGSTTLDRTMVVSHTQILTGLVPGSTYHYIVRSMDAAGNRGSSLDAIFTTAGGAAGGATGAVAWSALVNTSASGGTLTKTGGGEGMDDARAVSTQQVGTAGGAIEFVAGDVTSIRFAALSQIGGQGWDAMDFAIRLGPWNSTSGIAEVREKRTWRADTPYVVGDKFRIEVASGLVRYYRNGVLFYTSAVAATSPLKPDASIFGVGAKIVSATISSGSTTTTTTGSTPGPDGEPIFSRY